MTRVECHVCHYELFFIEVTYTPGNGMSAEKRCGSCGNTEVLRLED